MPLLPLTELPGSATLNLVTADGVPFILSRLSEGGAPRDIRVSAFKGPGLSQSRLARSLLVLSAAGAVEFDGDAEQAKLVTLTAHGVALVGVYRSLLAWTRLVSLDFDPAGSFPSWRVMALLAAAWDWGVLAALAGRTASTDDVADAIGRGRDEVEDLLVELSTNGLVTRTGPGNATWLLLKDLKRAAAPLAAAVAVEQAYGSTVTPLLPVHIELVSRLCIESINAGHFSPSLDGSYAALCRMPDGQLSGSVAEFSGGEFYSIHSFRSEEQVDGGFWGTVEGCLSLLSEGRVDRVHAFGPNTRAGVRLASAVAVGLGHTRRTYASEPI